MKRTRQLTLGALALACCLSAAEPSASVKQAVTTAQNEWVGAILKGDRATLEKLITPDLSYTHSSTKTQTREEVILDATGKGATNYKSIEFSDAKLRQFGDTVIITEKAVVDTVQVGKSHLYVTEVWVKQGGHWQLASRQATKLPA